MNLDGQIVEINVSLQNSAQITGHLVLPDGTTPAAQALVAIQTAGRTLTLYTDDTGAFTLPSLPLGSFLLVLEQHLGPGTREVRGTLTSNGQVLDLGTLVLDAVDPQVTAVTPAPGAVDVPRAATVTVRFSEPMDTTRNLVGNLVRIETATGDLVGSGAVWVDGDTAIQATPHQPLANASIFRINIDRSQLFDKAGRELAQSVQTTFTTADQVPPAVIAVTPASGARQVPLDAPVRVTFSEVVNPATLSGSALQLTDADRGRGRLHDVLPRPDGTRGDGESRHGPGGRPSLSAHRPGGGRHRRQRDDRALRPDVPGPGRHGALGDHYPARRGWGPGQLRRPADGERERHRSLGGVQRHAAARQLEPDQDRASLFLAGAGADRHQRGSGLPADRRG